MPNPFRLPKPRLKSLVLFCSPVLCNSKEGGGRINCSLFFPWPQHIIYCNYFCIAICERSFNVCKALDVSRIKTHELKLIYQIGYRISPRASNWYKKDIAMQLVGKHYLRLFLYSGNDIFSGTICMTLTIVQI